MEIWMIISAGWLGMGRRTGRRAKEEDNEDDSDDDDDDDQKELEGR